MAIERFIGTSRRWPGSRRGARRRTFRVQARDDRQPAGVARAGYSRPPDPPTDRAKPPCPGLAASPRREPATTDPETAPNRYDEIATGYARWWGPVLAPSARGLLDRLAGPPPDATVEILDVGAGTGVLSLAAVERWPGARVTAIDASAGMLDLLAAALVARPAAERVRVRAVVADAASMPLADASIDLAISSFALQLVASRAAAYGEIRRVLRPGGRVAFVSWLQGGPPFGADAVFDAVLEEFDLEPREWSGGSDDYASPAAAAAGLRRAGFRRVSAIDGELVHRFTPEEYAGFLEHFDERELFEELEPAVRDELRRRLVRRLAALDPGGLVLRSQIVYVEGERPG